MDGNPIAPGVYSVAELAELFDVSVQTVRKWIDKHNFETTELIRHGKQVKGVVLTPELITALARDGHREAPGLKLVRNRSETGGSTLQALQEVIETERERFETLYASRMQDKDLVIASLTQQVETLRNQVETLNNQVQASNSAIQRYKSLDDQLREIRDAVKKPFWAFWKK